MVNSVPEFEVVGLCEVAGSVVEEGIVTECVGEVGADDYSTSCPERFVGHRFLV